MCIRDSHFGTVWQTKPLKTGFQNSIKKSAENRHPFYEILGSFWGSFLSKKSVVCRSKMSLTCGPLKIVILAPSGHPKSIKFGVIFWWKFDRFSDDGDKQCIRINALFSKELMLFQQFCYSVVGGYEQVQAHLWSRASTFYALPVPLPRQVYLLVQMGVWKWGRKKCWKSCSKGSPNGPQTLLKIDKSVFWRGLKKGPQKWTLARIRKSGILPLFTTL